MRAQLGKPLTAAAGVQPLAQPVCTLVCVSDPWHSFTWMDAILSLPKKEGKPPDFFVQQTQSSEVLRGQLQSLHTA